MSIESGFSINSVQVAPALHQIATDIKKERRLNTLPIEANVGKKVIAPDSKRQAVRQVVEALDVSERKACQVIGWQNPRYGLCTLSQAVLGRMATLNDSMEK